MEDLDTLLQDLAAGRLAPDERQRLERRLDQEPGLAARFEQAQARHALLAPLAQDSFGPFFAARLLHRLENLPQAADWAAGVQAVFARFALLPGALALLLLALTLAQTGLDPQGFLAVETGLESFYLDDIYQIAP